MNYLISQQLLQTLVGYLAERPYKEVAGLIQALDRCPAAPAPEPKSEGEDTPETPVG